MKKLLQLFMVLALVLVPSMCFAQREFPDGTVLNDKEEVVYGEVEELSKNFIDPASIRFRKVGYIRLDWDCYLENLTPIDVAISAKTRGGGRVLKTYSFYKGEAKYIGGHYECEDGIFSGEEDKDVDISKLNNLWVTYHSND